MVKEPHKHHFKDIELARIMRISRRKSDFSYNGTPGDKAMLIRRCDGFVLEMPCKEIQAFDYGSTEAMEERYMQLTGARSVPRPGHVL